MIIVKEYRGHIRNWEALCKELNIDASLKREAREEEILIRAYQTWGCEMADHMHGMFAFALWDEEEKKLFCLRDQFGTKPLKQGITSCKSILQTLQARLSLPESALHWLVFWY